MLVHHVGKDASKGPRGASALGAAVDEEIVLSKTAKSDLIKVRNTKQKNAKEFDNFAVELQVVDVKGVRGAAPGEKYNSCVLNLSNKTIASSDSNTGDDDIILALKVKPRTHKDLRASVDLPKSTFDRRLTARVKAGEVIKPKRGGKYRLVENPAEADKPVIREVVNG